ncbi:hypothetical protein LWI28_020011 [Acer negundo]|uniref:FAR1 domain-containing protein n=1 Tax=Acer negundo TaxID=4023 RepID=A0AAD5IDG3_ACENE|nr:hypothetical protein LWI28_020011 [Acer negundo]
MEDTFNGEDDGELKVGMKVHSDKAAYDLYNAYALKKGFSIRKWHIRRDATNNIRQREFVCSKEGIYKDQDLCEVKKLNRLDTRTGCKAMIRFIVDNGVWTISHVNSEHNHELAKSEEKQFLRSGQKISCAHGDVVSSMVGAGIGPTKAYFYLANEAGGAENLGFLKKDARNYLQRQKDEMLESMGMLCRHALKVLDFNNVTSIPSKYILKRWIKEARKGNFVSCESSVSLSNNEKHIQLLSLSELMHEGNNFFSIASLTVSGTKIVKNKLVEEMELLEKDSETISMLECFKKVDEQLHDDLLSSEPPILNPPITKTKGQTNARLKSNLEKRKRKTTKGKGKEIQELVSDPSHGTTTYHHSATNPHLTATTYHATTTNPIFQQSLVSQNLSFYHQVGSNFSFTSMLQRNDQISHLSQVSNSPSVNQFPSQEN